MAKLRVLVLQSVEDELTRNRMAIRRASPALDDYIVEYCYAVELTKGQHEMDIFTMMAQVTSDPIDEDDLLRRLDAKITSFHPDILMVHSGFVFSTYPRQCLSALLSLKSKHPELRIGCQSRGGLDPASRRLFDQVFEQNNELNKLAWLVI